MRYLITALCLLLATSVYAADIKVQYTFKGNTIGDDSGIYVAKLQNGARIIKMKDGNRVLYTGLDDGYLDLGSALGNEVVSRLSADLTISIDLMVDADDNSLSSDGNLVWVFASQEPDSKPSNYMMMKARNGAVGYTMRYGGGTYRTETSRSLTTGKWHTLTYVHSGRNTYLYIDGEVAVAANSSSSIYYSPAQLFKKAGSLDYNYIGKPAATDNAYLRNTCIDNFVIEDRAWTAEEVAAAYKNAASLSNKSTEIQKDNLASKYDFWSHDGLIELMTNVDRTWQERMGYRTRSFWNWAVFHTGNMEVVRYLNERQEQQTIYNEFKEFSENWGEANNWYGSTGDDPSLWRYTYGEESNYALFGDWQCCFQTYIDLYNLDGQKNERMVARAKQVMSYMMRSDTVDYWWWADALYMAMPVLPKMYNLTGDNGYLDKLYFCFDYARNLMYNEQDHLFFRDANYVYPMHRTSHGMPDYWSRGDGWVVAGLAKVLATVPKNWRRYGMFEDIYKDMCSKVITCQVSEGFWPESLCDSLFATCRESSGTSLFTYGLLWGVNNGVLKPDVYMPAINRAWTYLTEIALQEDWTVGYMQPIGAAANEGAQLYPSNITDFGTGAFLLAAAEMARYADAHPRPVPGDVNEDKQVDINDVVAIINQMAGTATWQYADVNDDEKVDINDVVAVINLMAEG